MRLLKPEKRHKSNGYRYFYILCAICLVLPGQALALRCDSRLVSTGMRAAQIRQACGPPSAVYPLAVTPVRLNQGQQWVYNFGPHRLLYLLYLRVDVLQAERTDGYGFVIPAVPDCDLGTSWVDHSLYRLLQYCGEPARRSAYVLYRRARPQVPDRLRVILHETLVYPEAGNGKPARYVVENGWVVSFRDD